MAELTITRPRTDGRPLHTVTTSSHPKAIIKAEDGTTFELPYAPQGANLGGWAAEWSTIDRPGRRPLVVRDGDGIPTLGIDVLLAGRDHQDSVEGKLTKLRKLAAGGERITLVNLSPAERGPWRLEAVSVAATLRQHGTNHITRAAVGLGFIAAVDAKPRLGPVSGGKKGGKGITKPRHYTIKKGDTLRKLARRFYGEPNEWRRIAKANKIKDPDKLKVGRRIRIPADDKKD